VHRRRVQSVGCSINSVNGVCTHEQHQVRFMIAAGHEHHYRARGLRRVAAEPDSSLNPALDLRLLLIDKAIDAVDSGVNLTLRTSQHVAATSGNDIGILVGHGF
jgi:hypothetical protein